MRSPQAKSIRDRMMAVLHKKGKEFTKAEYRRVKKFYKTIPRKDRHKFSIS